MENAAAGEGGAVRLERRGAIGKVALDPAAGPVSAADWQRWVTSYDAWIDDPNVYGGLIRCTGRRLRQSSERGGAPDPAPLYRLIWTIDRFSKPTVALVNGTMSWADFCLVRHGTHKVVGEDFRLSFALPERRFPDQGATWWLARLPDGLGSRLALTGAVIDGADALALGLATHRISATTFDLIEHAYAEADPIDQVLDRLPTLTGGGTLADLGRLAAEGRATADGPLDPNLTLSLLDESARLTLKETLERDFALALASRGPEDRSLLTPSDAGPFRQRAMAELALKPPPTVPEALG